jgi:SAM-dependent methyltransferase
MPAKNATERFSSRVENYTRFRPGYPREIIDLLKHECGLNANSVIADIASGTGLFTKLLLEHGNRVFGVEPNAEMRHAGEAFLARYPRFTSVAGKAEGTTLPDSSVNFVTAAQAAHWFDRENARREFVRILKPGGWIVMIWNERLLDATPFLRDYENVLLTYGTDYKEVRHERTTAEIAEFFAPSPFHARNFEMYQEFDYAGLEGRLLSSSYIPGPGHANYQTMLRDLRHVFNEHEQSGHVLVKYETRVFYSQLG